MSSNTMYTLPSLSMVDSFLNFDDSNDNQTTVAQDFSHEFLTMTDNTELFFDDMTEFSILKSEIMSTSPVTPEGFMNMEKNLAVLPYNTSNNFEDDFFAPLLGSVPEESIPELKTKSRKQKSSTGVAPRRRSINTFVNKQGKVIRGKPCNHPSGCTSRAQSFGRCKTHGGGKRCSVVGCSKSSQGGGLCRTHGGGKKCSVDGCDKGAQKAGLCHFHGKKATTDNTIKNSIIIN